MSGVLSRLGRKGEKPTPPVNLLADFAGGGMIAAMGVVTALFERQRSGLGQVVEASMTEGASYISSFLQCSRDMGIWMGERGSNLLDTGAPFYDTYATKDGHYMAVGAIEPQFYQRFLTGLGREDLTGKEYKISEWPEVKEEIAKTFLTKTFEEWTEIFAPIDACVTPVLDLYEAPHHPHNISSESFMKDGDNFNPSPAPRLSRTPAVNKCRPLPHTVGEHTRDVLLEYGFQQAEINDLIEENHVEEPQLPSSKL